MSQTGDNNNNNNGIGKIRNSQIVLNGKFALSVIAFFLIQSITVGFWAGGITFTVNTLREDMKVVKNYLVVQKNEEVKELRNEIDKKDKELAERA